MRGVFKTRTSIIKLSTKRSDFVSTILEGCLVQYRHNFQPNHGTHSTIQKQLMTVCFLNLWATLACSKTVLGQTVNIFEQKVILLIQKVSALVVLHQRDLIAEQIAHTQELNIFCLSTMFVLCPVLYNCKLKGTLYSQLIESRSTRKLCRCTDYTQ